MKCAGVSEGFRPAPDTCQTPDLVSYSGHGIGGDCDCGEAQIVATVPRARWSAFLVHLYFESVPSMIISG